MKLLLSVSFIFIGLTFISCSQSSTKYNPTVQKIPNETSTKTLIDSLTVYESENLIIKRLSKHVYVHISYLRTNDFGKVACNGMLLINEKKGIVFDTPTDDKSSFDLINFVTRELKTKLIAVIPTHFHEDCVGGVDEFEKNNIPLFAANRTIAFFNKNGKKFSKPIKGFDNSISLNIGDKIVHAEYFGEGHTRDNVVGYFPEENTVFGGCLIKEVGASKGFLGDANTLAWSETVAKVKLKYPDAKIVIPGHGKWGATELFDYTINLFKQ